MHNSYRQENVTIVEERVLATSPLNIYLLQQCTYEEAAYILMFHSAHDNHTRIMIHAIYTDVFVFAIVSDCVPQKSEIWLAFRHKTKIRYVFAHKKWKMFGHSICFCSFSLFSGCDIVPLFCGIGKV